MSKYTPETWEILKITNGDNIHYRVFAGWYGGYLSGDSWKMNSGITSIVETEQTYEIAGLSGSTYSCYKEANRMSGYMGAVLASFQDDAEEKSKKENITIKFELVPISEVIEYLAKNTPVVSLTEDYLI